MAGMLFGHIVSLVPTDDKCVRGEGVSFIDFYVRATSVETAVLLVRGISLYADATKWRVLEVKLDPEG